MAFVLKGTNQFKADLTELSLIPEVSEKLEKTFWMMEDGPERHQESLQSEKLLRFPKAKIWKSRVDQSYRLLWTHGSGRNEIILARIGAHDFIDYVATVTDLNSATLIVRHEPAQAIASRPTSSQQRVWRYQPPSIFGKVPDNILRLLGVPKPKVDEVKHLTDINSVFDIGLPDYAAEVLMDLYTKPDITIEDALTTPRVLYRATADQLQGYCKGELKQLLLELTSDQMRLVEIKTNGPTLIKGVAGSGKTTVGIRRAMTDCERETNLFNSHKPRVMFTTYTETLAKSVRQMFVEQYGVERAKQVEVHVLREWMRRYIGSPEIGSRAMLETCLATSIASIRKEQLDSTVFKMSRPRKIGHKTAVA